MAGPYRCDICEENQAAMILGMVETGDQQFLCGPCAGRFGLDLAKNLLTPEEIAEALGPMFVEGGRQDGPPKSRRGRKAEAATEAEPEPPRPPATEGVEEPQAADSDG